MESHVEVRARTPHKQSGYIGSPTSQRRSLALMTLLLTALTLLPLAHPVLAQQAVLEDKVTDPSGDPMVMALPSGVSMGQLDVVEVGVGDAGSHKVIYVRFAEPPDYLQNSLATTFAWSLVLLINTDDDPRAELQVMVGLPGYAAGTAFLQAMDEYSQVTTVPDALVFSGDALWILIPKDQLGPLGSEEWRLHGINDPNVLSPEYTLLAVNYLEAMGTETVESPQGAPESGAVLELPAEVAGRVTGVAAPTETQSPSPTETTTTTATSPTLPPGHQTPPPIPGDAGTLLWEYADPEGDVFVGGAYPEPEYLASLDSVDLTRFALYENDTHYTVVLETKGDLDPRFFDPQYQAGLIAYVIEVDLYYDTPMEASRVLVYREGYVLDEASGNMVNALGNGLVSWGGNRAIISIPKNLIPSDLGEVQAVYVGDVSITFAKTKGGLTTVDDKLDNAEAVKSPPYAGGEEPTYTIPVETTVAPVCKEYTELSPTSPPISGVVLAESAVGRADEGANWESIEMGGLYLDPTAMYQAMLVTVNTTALGLGGDASVRVALEASLMGQEVKVSSEPVRVDPATGMVTTRIPLPPLPQMAGGMPSIMINAKLVIYNDVDCTKVEVPFNLVIEGPGPGPMPGATETEMPRTTTMPMGEPTMPGMGIRAEFKRADIYTYEKQGREFVAYWVEAEIEGEGAVDYQIVSIAHYKDGSVEESDMGRLSELLQMAREEDKGRYVMSYALGDRKLLIEVIQDRPGSMEKVRLKMLVEAPLQPGEKSARELESIEFKVIGMADKQGTQWNSVTVPLKYRLHNNPPPAGFYQEISGQKEATSTPSPTKTPTQTMERETTKPSRETPTTTKPAQEKAGGEEEAPGAGEAEAKGDGGSGALVAAVAVVIVLAAGGFLFMKKGRA